MKASNKNEQRIMAILQIRLDGAEQWDICQFIAEQEGEIWQGKPMTPAQIGELIKVADDRIAAAYPNDPPDVARHKAKLKSLYARAVQVGDVRTARSILCDLAKMEGIGKKRTTPIIPSPAKAATEKLKAQIRKDVNHAERQTPQADSLAQGSRNIQDEPPCRAGADASAGHPEDAPAPFPVRSHDVAQAD